MIKIQELLQEEISRKEFLRYIGVALLSMVGVASFLQSLASNFSKKHVTTIEHKQAGYGATPYGH